MTLNTDGTFTYDPDPGFTGNDAFTYQANDGNLDSNVATVTISVGSVLVTVPDVVGSPQATAEAAIISANLAVGTVTTINDEAVPAGNVISQTPAPEASVAQGTEVHLVVSLGPVNPPPDNNAPEALDDTYNVDEDTVLDVAVPGVLGSDNDPDNDPMTAVLVDNPFNGSVTLNADGSFTYTPNPDFHGPDSFTYLANDGQLDSNVAVVNITVNPVPDAPVAVDDQVSVPEDITLLVTGAGALGNDFDVDGDSITAVKVSDPDNGTLVAFNSDGTFEYSPNPNFFGQDSFTYKANDDALDSNVATVTITVDPVPDAPVAGDDSYTVDQDTTLTEPAPGVLANDFDVDGDTLLAALDTNVSHGTLALASDGSFTYIPTAGYSGPDGFTYRANDGGLDSNVATVSIDVQAVVPGVSAIVVEPGNETILVSQIQQFRAYGVFADGTGQEITGAVTWDTSNPAAASVNAGGQASGQAQGNTVITATLNGVVSNAASLNVVAPVADTTIPTVAITSPASDATITTPTDIIGTADDANFLKYVVEISPVGQNSFTTIATGTSPVISGVLGQLDPTLLINDLYTVRLTAFDKAGNGAQIEVMVQVARDMKVGNFTVAFEDLSVPASCLPVTVTRVYDSRDRGQGDFGFGWRLDVNTIRLRESHAMGAGWFLELRNVPGPFGILIPTYFLLDNDLHKVSISLPDGKVEEFDLRPQPNSQQFSPPVPDAVYVARPGTLGTLTALQPKDLFILGSANSDVDLVLESDPLTLYDPQRYRYTAPDGTAFIINKSTGLESVQCANGPTLTIQPDGIASSLGTGVAFTRDAQGRITQITDPNGNVHPYAYDPVTGDLASYTDPEGNLTSFKYNYRHGLLEIIDPRGVTGIRNEYDAQGRLISNTDANGQQVRYNHDLINKEETVTDRRGNATIFRYDDQGNVLEQVDALGHSTVYTYDAFGNEETETDPLGNTTSRTFDSRRNVLAEEDPLGNITRFTYTSQNAVRQITDPLGRVTNNNYDAFGNLLTTTDPLGGVTNNTYDTGGIILPGTGNLTSTTDALNNTTSFAYDGFGNLTSQTDAQGNVTSFTYDANGNQLTQTATRADENGNPVTMTTTFVYDRNNRVVETIDPDGASSFIEYNAIGQQAATIDKNGNRAQFEYDPAGNLITTTFPDGTAETSTYDQEGNVTASTDRAGRTTSFQYDALNRLTRTTFPDGSFASTIYDAAGRVLTTTDENGNATSFQYDAAGRRTKVIDALNQETQFFYDANGNQTSFTDANGHTTSFEYDALNRRTRTVFPDTTFTQTGYDALGRRTAETDQAGLATQFQYGALGRLTKVVDALGQETTYTYDEAGNRLTQTDANLNATAWAYDNLGRATKRTLPLGMSETFTYDNNGNLLSRTDFNGAATTFVYDVNNRLTGKTFPDTTGVTYAYTPNGLQQTVTDSRGATSYSYDARDRLLQQTNPNGSALTYTYDAAGNRTSVAIASGTTSYAYDALNRLETVTDPQGGVTAYSYDNVGNRAGVTYPNGTVTSYTYDTLNRLTLLENLRSDGSVIATYAYTLGPAGNRIRVVEDTGRRVDYTYDSLYRLTGETITGALLGNQTISYTYDPMGNRLSKTDGGGTTSYAYDANDRLLSEGGNTYAYDANGNTLSQTDGATTTTYTYDFENRLVDSQTPASSIQYAYDADGIRAQSMVDGAVTNFLVDRNRPFAQVLEERDGAGALVVDYVYGDDLISQRRSGATNYYHYDGLGSARALTDGAETVTDTYTYEAFGTLLGSTGATPNNYLFTGEQYDPNVGFYYLRARYYNQVVGRFTTSDAFPGLTLDPGTLHKYLYTQANPVNAVDPSGNFALALATVLAYDALLPLAESTRLLATGTRVRSLLGLDEAATDRFSFEKLYGRSKSFGVGIFVSVGIETYRITQKTSSTGSSIADHERKTGIFLVTSFGGGVQASASNPFSLPQLPSSLSIALTATHTGNVFRTAQERKLKQFEGIGNEVELSGTLFGCSGDITFTTLADGTVLPNDYENLTGFWGNSGCSVNSAATGSPISGTFSGRVMLWKLIVKFKAID